MCFIPGASGALSCSPQNFHLKNLVFKASWVFYFELSWQTCPLAPSVGLADTGFVSLQHRFLLMRLQGSILHWVGWGGTDSPTCSPTGSTLRSEQKSNVQHWILTFEKVQSRGHETFRREDGGLEANSVTDEQDWASF